MTKEKIDRIIRLAKQKAILEELVSASNTTLFKVISDYYSRELDVNSMDAINVIVLNDINNQIALIDKELKSY